MRRTDSFRTRCSTHSLYIYCLSQITKQWFALISKSNKWWIWISIFTSFLKAENDRFQFFIYSFQTVVKKIIKFDTKKKPEDWTLKIIPKRTSNVDNKSIDFSYRKNLWFSPTKIMTGFFFLYWYRLKIHPPTQLKRDLSFVFIPVSIPLFTANTFNLNVQRDYSSSVGSAFLSLLH